MRMDGVSGDMSLVWKFFFAFLFVLILIGVAAWLVRRFGVMRTNTSNNRGRMPRLAVIDATAVDSRRRLVLVRRDNVEHLLMIGGPSDIVVEPNIQRAPVPRGNEPAARGGAPTAEPGWNEPEFGTRPEPVELGAPAPMPEPPPRPARPAGERRPEPFVPIEPAEPAPPAFAHERPRPPAPAMREAPARETAHEDTARAAPPRASAPELTLRSAPRAAPTIRPAPQAAAGKSDDQNLAEMAQRLEAALRRPGLGDAPADAGALSANSAAKAAAAPKPPAAPPPAMSEPAAPPVAPEPSNESADAGPSADLKSLEDEMASLLGRPKKPS